ncbi:MAG: hypothetical protein ACHQAU_06075 [Gammaproteobacteria bacterium]
MSKLKFSVVLAASLMAGAAWGANDPFVGAWKLNPSKSQPTDQMKVETAGGNKFTFDFGPGAETVTADGTDQPGYGGTTLAVTLLGPDALKVVRKKEGHTVVTADWKLAEDGKTLSDDFTTFAPDGSVINLKYVYQRTTAASGFAGTWESSSAKVNFELTIKFQPYGKGGLSLISPTSDRPKDLSFDGKDYPNLSSNAPSGTTYSARRADERSVEISDKLNGKAVDTQQYTLSSDHKTLTLSIHRAGMQTASIYVFDRE